MFFEAEVEANNYEAEAEARPVAYCYCKTFISWTWYSIQKFGEYLICHKFRKYTSYYKVSK